MLMQPGEVPTALYFSQAKLQLQKEEPGLYSVIWMETLWPRLKQVKHGQYKNLRVLFSQFGNEVAIGRDVVASHPAVIRLTHWDPEHFSPPIFHCCNANAGLLCPPALHPPQPANLRLRLLWPGSSLTLDQVARSLHLHLWSIVFILLG